MSSLKRSTTYVNGQLREPGKSESDIITSKQQEITNEKNPYTTSFEDWNRYHNEESSLANTWLNSKNMTTDNRTFKEFKVEEGAKRALDRLTNKGGKRRRSLRKYKKSAKRVFRKKSRSTRRR
jgi:hypothetical protein